MVVPSCSIRPQHDFVRESRDTHLERNSRKPFHNFAHVQYLLRDRISIAYQQGAGEYRRASNCARVAGGLSQRPRLVEQFDSVAISVNIKACATACRNRSVLNCVVDAWLSPCFSLRVLRTRIDPAHSMCL